MKIYKTSDAICKKRISFILATRNRASFLEKALNEYKELVQKNDELIIIDGNSTDNSLSVIKKKQKLIDLVLSEKDINPTHAANKGLLLANGKYIKLLSDDDIIYPKELEKAIKVMNKHPEIDIMVCGGTWSRVGENSIKINYAPPNSNYGSKKEDIFKYGACGQGFIIRRASLPQIGLFDSDDWFSDVSFIVKAIKKGACVKFCRINLYHAYAHPDTTGNKYKNRVEQSRLKLIRENAELTYKIRYIFNQFVDKNFFLKVLFNNIFRILNKFKKNDNSLPTKIKWDGGLS